MNTDLAVAHPESTELSLGNKSAFEHIQRVAQLFSASQLVPTAFQGNLPNCVVAMELASRMGASPFAVIQNLNIIHGKPSFSSQFLIATINTCGRFLPLRFHIDGEGDERTCIAWTIEMAVARIFGDKLGKLITLPLARTQSEVPYLEGAPVTIAMAKAEGWYGKNGSKWKTMPDLMLRYRAATFFTRLYAPEMAMGLQTAEEVIDITTSPVVDDAPATDAQPEQGAAPEQPAKQITRRRSGVAKAQAEPKPVAATEPPATLSNTPSNPAPEETSAAVPPAAEAQAEPPAPAADEKPADKQPEAEPAKANVRTVRAEITRAVVRTPRDQTKAAYCEVQLSGADYTGTAYYLGSIDNIPDAGAIADIELEARESSSQPGTFAQFILKATVVA